MTALKSKVFNNAPTMSATEKLALEVQAQTARGVVEVKSATPAHAESQALADLLIERVGNKNNVRATPVANQVELTDGVVSDLGNFDLIVLSSPRGDFQIVNKTKRGVVVRAIRTLEELRAMLPERAKGEHVSRALFPMTFQSRSVYENFAYAESATPTNRIEYATWDSEAKRGIVRVNGINFNVRVTTMIEEHPERFDAEGKYKSIRKATKRNGKALGESATGPDRTLFVVDVGYVNGVYVHYSDMGFVNLFDKINGRQDRAVEAKTDAHTLFVKTKSVETKTDAS